MTDSSKEPSKGAWTPGPWDLMAGMPTNVLCNAGYRVARCDFDGDFNHPEGAANALLISKAPQMAELLLEMREHTAMPESTFEKLERLLTDLEVKP